MPYKDPDKRKEYHLEYDRKWRRTKRATDPVWKKKDQEAINAWHRKKYSTDKEWRERVNLRKREQQRRRREESPEIVARNNALTRETNDRKRRYAIAHYGNKCNCCGEERYEFLAFDHVNNDGAEHRRNHKGSIVNWLHREGFPDTIQVLCHNCNSAKGYYGVCPHQTEGK